MINVRQSRMGRLLVRAIATGFFVGYFPLVPGTFGTLWGVCIVYGLRGASLAVYGIATLLIGALGYWACNVASHLFKKEDAPQIVIDEVVGFMVTMVAVPVTGYSLALGFLVFRYFDMVKVFPIHFIDQRLKNGWGVLLDDVVAGVFGNIVLHCVMRAKI